MDIRLALMCGTDIPIPECQLIIHQPRMREIALIGEEDFFTGIQCLNLNKMMFSQGENILQNSSNFQIFTMIMTDVEAKDKKTAVQQVLSLLFPNEHIFITPRSLIIGAGIIDEQNFDIFQEHIKEIFCLRSQSVNQNTFNPADAEAKRIAEKIMRGRKRVAEINGEANVSIFSQYISALTVGLHSMSLQEIMDLTMFQLYDLIERYQLYLNWDIDIKSRLAGAKPDSKPENWMKNIH